jgi:putative heme-binding domain-containing protein
MQSPQSCIVAVCLAQFLFPTLGGAQEWKSLFNGKDLEGWSGDPRIWEVREGVLTGETNAADRQIRANSFLIWQGGEPTDFELEFKARVTGSNNSGVQYRSRTVNSTTWAVHGYQMDLHPQPNYLGMLYEEGGRGIACESGQSVELGASRKVVGALERPPTKLEEWNSYRIVARGNSLQHFVNGNEVARIRDDDPSKRSMKGVLALQLHAGPPMKAEFKEIRLRENHSASGAARGSGTSKVAEPPIHWIWESDRATDHQKVFFRRQFELPKDVVSATVTVTCDNWQRLWVNGKDFGFTSEWAAPASHDVSSAIVQGGQNVIAVEGRNQGGVAAMALRLTATLKDGGKVYVVTNGDWLASLEAPRGWQEPAFTPDGWKSAVVVGRMGVAPWNEVIPAEGDSSSMPEDMTAEYQLLDGFKLERLYKVPNTQGSWVAMTVDGGGRLLCADQYGKIHLVIPAADPDEETVVKPTAIPLRGAHGLLWHEGVLWVTVNEGEDAAGVWRVTDSDGDGMPDRPELIKGVRGRGEHGPHALVPSPDGQWIYFVAGNHTDLPEFDSSLVPKVWQEDQLLPRRPDAKGHATDRMAPGGWIARFKPDGTQWELFSVGFRNAYDIAFNHEGDLFAYDADMEWDFGMPWYRPTRINHVVPGSEFGWRNGTGKWPEYYEDSMGSLVDLGPGSPTGFLSGRGAKFPAKYQRALYAFDWTYATIHAIHLTPGGRGYRADREEFLAATGMPLTDATIGHDGAMYFLSGGRRTASALWRITYGGSESTASVPQLKKTLAHVPLAGAWDGMGSEERVQRYESRTAVETAGAVAIIQRLAKESDPWKSIQGAMALARVGEASHRPLVVEALVRLDWDSLHSAQRINWLRAAGLAFARHGEPTPAERTKVLATIDSRFPSNDRLLDRELCRMLSYLQAPGIVGRTLALMDTTGPSPAPDWLAVARRNPQYGDAVVKMIANLPPEQIIHYIYCLRVVKGPWSVDERKRYLAWFDRLLQNSGGNSYAGFIDDLRKQTLANATPEEMEWISKLEPALVPHPLANLPPVKGPGREWTINEVEKIAAAGFAGADVENGRQMYKATLCAACHRFGGEGGAAGPDLSALAGRFTVRDIAEALIEPSKVISDQYAFDTIVKKDGTQVIGKLIEEKDEHWIVAVSPFDFSQRMEVERNEIEDIVPSPVSPMPAGLINRLNAEELRDLLAYLLGE